LKNGLCEPTNSNAHDSMSNHTEQNYGAKRCRSWNSRIAKQCINRFPTVFVRKLQLHQHSHFIPC